MHELEPLRVRFLTQARRLIARNRWGLAGPEALADATLEHYRYGRPADAPEGEPDERQIADLVRGTYASRLCTACRQEHDRDLRDRALVELHTYLLALARQREPENAEELAQAALVRAYERRERCKKPRAFYYFALLEFQMARRATRQRHTHASIDDDLPVESETERLSDQDCLERVRIELGRMPQASRAVIELKLEGLSDEEIGARLGLTANAVRVRRNRAREHLRAQPSLAGCF